MWESHPGVVVDGVHAVHTVVGQRAHDVQQRRRGRAGHRQPPTRQLPLGRGPGRDASACIRRHQTFALVPIGPGRYYPPRHVMPCDSIMGCVK